MKFSLGTMSVGDILDRGLKILLSRFGTFFLIHMLVQGPSLVIQLSLPFLFSSDVIPLPGPGGEDQEVLTGTQIGILLAASTAGLITLLLLPIGMGATLHIIAREYTGEPATLSEALNVALDKFLALLGTGCLVYLLLGGVFVVLGCGGIIVLSLIVAALTGAAGAAGPQAAAALGLVVGLATMFGVGVVVLLLYTWYAFFGQVVVMENLAGVEAMSRSKELVSGFYPRCLLLVFLLILLTMIAPALLMMPIEHFFPPFEILPKQPPLFLPQNYLAEVGIRFLLGVLFNSFFTIGITLAYFDLRARKEGFDLDVAVRQEGAGGEDFLNEPRQPRRSDEDDDEDDDLSSRPGRTDDQW